MTGINIAAKNIFELFFAFMMATMSLPRQTIPAFCSLMAATLFNHEDQTPTAPLEPYLAQNLPSYYHKHPCATLAKYIASNPLPAVKTQ